MKLQAAVEFPGLRSASRLSSRDRTRVAPGDMADPSMKRIPTDQLIEAGMAGAVPDASCGMLWLWLWLKHWGDHVWMIVWDRLG